MKLNNLGAHIALLCVTIIYGANYTIAKEIISGEFMHPMALVFFRILSALILFLIIHFYFIKEKVERSDLLILAICSFFGVMINQSFFITGLKYTSPINASVLMVTAPLLVLLISFIMKVEQLTPRKLIGVLLGAGGTLILIFGKGQMDFSGTLKGNVYILINAFSYAMYLVMVKPLMKKYNPLTIVKWIFIFGIVGIIPFSWREVITTNWQNFTPAIWLSFIYVLLFVTFFSYLLNASALKKVKPSTVGIYIYLQPVIASIVALSLGRDELSPLKIFSGMIIVYGVYLVSTQKAMNFAKK